MGVNVRFRYLIIQVLSKNLETLLTFSLAATGVMESKLDQSVVGVAVGQVARAAFSPGVAGTQLLLVCTTAAGKCLRVDVGAALATVACDTGEGRLGELDAATAAAAAGTGAGDSSGGVVDNGVKGVGLAAVAMSAIFFYHTGDVGAVACSSEKSGTAMICTAGDDCILCLWDGITHTLLSREVIPVRAQLFDFILIQSDSTASCRFCCLPSSYFYHIHHLPPFSGMKKDEIRSVGFDKTSGYICLGTEEGMLRVRMTVSMYAFMCAFICVCMYGCIYMCMHVCM